MPFRLLSWLAPALLCVVALLQLGVTSGSLLSPWKLGGFGMYSGVDSIGARWIRPVLVAGPGELPLVWESLVEERPDLVRAARAVRSWPQMVPLARLGDNLLNESGVWADCTPARIAQAGRIVGRFVRPLAQEEVRVLGCRPLPVAALRLEVWRYRWDASSRRLSGEKLLEAGAVRR